jgi:hypothetical protein
MMPPSHSFQGSEVEDRLDREIALLRQLVEDEANGQDLPEEGAHAQSASWPFRIFATMRKHSPDRIAHRGLLPPMRLVVVLRPCQLVRRHSSAIALYGFCTSVALAAVWLVISMTEP